MRAFLLGSECFVVTIGAGAAELAAELGEQLVVRAAVVAGRSDTSGTTSPAVMMAHGGAQPWTHLTYVIPDQPSWPTSCSGLSALRTLFLSLRTTPSATELGAEDAPWVLPARPGSSDDTPGASGLGS